MQNNNGPKTSLSDPRTVFARHGDAQGPSRPIWLLDCESEDDKDAGVGSVFASDAAAKQWLDACGFRCKPGRHALVPDAKGNIKGVAFGLGGAGSGRPCGPGELLIGSLPRDLPMGSYNFSGADADGELAAIAWGLGSYRYERYKGAPKNDRPKLVLSEETDVRHVLNVVEAVWFGRDLINTPASDMGPDELEAAARDIASAFGAQVSVIAGDKLLDENFPMIHAVGRASPRAPRLIDVRWQRNSGRDDAPRVTLVGKGICFDTGGLDIKPPNNMILMKKDMGGAASALALGRMIMGGDLDVRLRILVAAAENSIDGSAFRPSDVLQSRAGLTVEVGNTDAEGRLVLADALSYADEEQPDYLVSLATLTGAARVALGPELPALFSTCDAFGDTVLKTGEAIGDPMWRMPFWHGYNSTLDSPIADISNIPSDAFAGAIAAALFLKRFVKKAHRYAHVDMYGWRPSAQPLGPKGGEVHAARALFAALREESGH